MNTLKFSPKQILKDSIFGQLFILWTAPIDNKKLDISRLEKPAKKTNWFFNNLIIGQKG